MQAYMTHDGCLMEFLADLLDDPTAAPCGHCASCRGRGMSREPSTRITSRAADLVPAPRPPTDRAAQAVAAGAVDGLSGKIAPPNEPGLALSVHGDAGWGREVQRARSVDGAFSSELVGGRGAGDPGSLAPERRHRPGSRRSI